MKRFMLFLSLAVAALCNSVLMSAQNVDNQQIVADIDKYAIEVKDTWHLPGFALAVSLDNKVIFAKGYGVKELQIEGGLGFAGARRDDRSVTTGGVQPVVNEPNAPIDTKTVFQIASVSKSFTATVTAQLVEEGKFKFTDTVKNLLPDFQMFKDNPYVTENMLVRDAMLHSTGLANEAGTYFGNLGYTRDEIYQMLGRLDPGFSFRSDYDYNNITFMIMSKLIEKYTGKSWEDNVRERIFRPLGMTSSNMNAAGYASAENVATPHDYSYVKDGKVSVLPLYGSEQALEWLTQIGPAGSLCSTAEDLIKYAQFQCNNGYIVNRSEDGSIRDTTFVMSAKAMRPLHRGYTVVGQDSTMLRLYGLCWFIEQNHDYKLFFHTGTAWGMTAICFYVPEYKLSGVMLVNCESTALPRYAMMRRIIDLARKAPSPLRDYNTEYWKEWTAEKESALARQEPDTEKIAEVPDISVFAGRYVKDELFGDAYVTLENGKLYFELAKKRGVPGFKNVMTHVSGTRYGFRCDGHGFNLTFTQDAESKAVTGFDFEFGEGEEKSLGGWVKASGSNK